jgi:aminomethyltransferase
MTVVFAPSEKSTRTRTATYQGFDVAGEVVSRRLRAGTEVSLLVQAGQEIEIFNVDGGASIVSTLLDGAGQCIELETFGDIKSPAGQSYSLKLPLAGKLICRIADHALGLEQGTGGTAEIRFKAEVVSLPEPLSKVEREIRILASTAQAYTVKAGEYIQIIDVQGQQCTDFMAVRQDALALGQERYIDSTVSRTLAGGAYPGPGLADKFFDQDMRPLLAVVQDTVGRHDTFALACTARGYEERGFSGHANCSDNISEAYAPFGIAAKTAWPAINLFFNSWILPGDNRLRSDEAWSRPGDYVVFRALTDLICVSTACPDDIDPINNWNPTDIHVRIYAEDQSIPTSVAYRSEPHLPAVLTQQSAFHPRTSQLTRHFSVARDVWLPFNYEATRAIEEYQACREAVTVQDLSSLLKFDVVGPDAERLLDHCLTRDVRKLSVNRGIYSLICDETGAVIDDGTLFRLAPDLFRWCCGSELSALQLKDVATQLDLTVWIRAQHQNMPNLAIQGPRSRELMQSIAFIQPTQPALENVKWFGFTQARIKHREGAPFMLTRTGYTGELGFEIFCHRKDALEIWDAVIEAGKPLGLKPMGGEALGMIRVEAGLAAHGAEFGRDIDAFEAGLGFAVDLAKADYIGKKALGRIKQSPRRLLTGLKFSSNDPPAHGDQVFAGRQCIGTITSAARSPDLGCAIALARVALEYVTAGIALEVGRLDGQMKRLPCTTTPFPFIDPQRTRARS